jgi:hypothetical protein
VPVPDGGIVLTGGTAGGGQTEFVALTAAATADQPAGHCRVALRSPTPRVSWPLPPLAAGTRVDRMTPELVHRIEIRLRELNQLFNSMDPSPFHEKDLDRDAEEFIVSWAQDLSLDRPFELIVHLDRLPSQLDSQAIEASIQRHFEYESKLARKKFRRLMGIGRASLAIGVLFLAACLTGSELLRLQANRTIDRLLYESLTIAGWVAMWRPMEIYLYEWWPLRRHCRFLSKLAQMRVAIRGTNS